MQEKMPGYNRGYAEGYQAGLRDGLAGKLPMDGLDGVLTLPIACLNLSARARNCLTHHGCQTIGDVAVLTEDNIRHMRKLGVKSAGEIAQALHIQKVLHTPWDLFLIE